MLYHLVIMQMFSYLALAFQYVLSFFVSLTAQ